MDGRTGAGALRVPQSDAPGCSVGVDGWTVVPLRGHDGGLELGGARPGTPAGTPDHVPHPREQSTPPHVPSPRFNTPPRPRPMGHRTPLAPPTHAPNLITSPGRCERSELRRNASRRGAPRPRAHPPHRSVPPHTNRHTPLRCRGEGRSRASREASPRPGGAPPTPDDTSSQGAHSSAPCPQNGGTGQRVLRGRATAEGPVESDRRRPKCHRSRAQALPARARRRARRPQAFGRGRAPGRGWGWGRA